MREGSNFFYDSFLEDFQTLTLVTNVTSVLKCSEEYDAYDPLFVFANFTVINVFSNMHFNQKTFIEIHPPFRFTKNYMKLLRKQKNQYWIKLLFGSWNVSGGIAFI